MISTDYVRPAAIKAGVTDAECPRFGLHNMRHGLATFLAERGTDPKVIQRMLRWSSTRMLQRYFHPKKQARKAQGEYMGRMGERVQVRVQQRRPYHRKVHEVWSGRRDLNPRLRPWQGRTLPLSYSRSALPL